jgi:cytochrome c553
MLPPSGDPWATQLIPADAADYAQRQAGAAVFAACASCHLADAGGRPDGAIPRLAGQPAEILAAKLLNIRNDKVFLPVMAAFANSLAPEEVGAVAVYVAALPAPTYVGHGDGMALSRGQIRYAEMCASCHGDHAEGRVALSAPRLCGQHFGYILQRVGEVIARRRADSDAAMSAISATLPADDLAAIADYLSRDTCAPPPAEASP